VLRKPSGASMVEYVVLIILLAGLVGGALAALFQTIVVHITSTYNNMNDPSW
jgi:Flp pilus assembly pilin Flp